MNSRRGILKSTFFSWGGGYWNFTCLCFVNQCMNENVWSEMQIISLFQVFKRHSYVLPCLNLP